MAEKDPISSIAIVTKGLATINTLLDKTKASMKEIRNLSGSVAGGFKSVYSTSGTGQTNGIGLGTSGASFGGGGVGGGSMMPWIYTKSGAMAYGGAQVAMGGAAAAYSLMPSLSIALPTRSAYYQGAITSGTRMTAADLAQRTLGALGPNGVSSPTDAAAAQMVLSQTYNFNPGGASYLRAMQEVGGLTRRLGMSNPEAAMAVAGLHTGDMSSRLYQAGISTLDPRTGTIRSTSEIYKQLYQRYYGGKGDISATNIEVGLREGFAGAEMRKVLGMSESQIRMVQDAFNQFRQGKEWNPPDATGKGNPALDIYRQQTSLAVTTETKADELLAGLTTATDAYVKMNEQLQGDGGVVSGLAKLKGVLEGIFGTNAGGAVTAIASTVGSVATTALMYKGIKALRGAGAAGANAMSKGGAATARVGGVKMAGATIAGNAVAKTSTQVAGRTAGVALGRAVPVIGGVIGAETGQGFLSTVAIGAVGGGIFGGPIGAAWGAGLSAVGWLGDKAFRAMFSTSKSQQTSGTTGQMNDEQWATALLQKMGAPVTSENLSAIMTWMKREGGGGTTTGIGAAGKKTAMYNPLNTTLGAPGATSFNKVGVRNYSSWDQGLQATLDTLQGTRGAGYENIMAALKQGNSATAVLQAVQQSSWSGKSHYGYNLASGPLVNSSGTASTSVSSGNNNVNITLTIDKASDAEAIAFAKKVKDLLMKDKTLSGIGSK